MHEVVNPFDLSVIGSVPTHDWDAVDAALEEVDVLLCETCGKEAIRRGLLQDRDRLAT